MYTMTKRAGGGRRVFECVHNGTCTHPVGRFDAVISPPRPPVRLPTHPASETLNRPGLTDWAGAAVAVCVRPGVSTHLGEARLHRVH